MIFKPRRAVAFGLFIQLFFFFGPRLLRILCLFIYIIQEWLLKGIRWCGHSFQPKSGIPLIAFLAFDLFFFCFLPPFSFFLDKSSHHIRWNYILSIFCGKIIYTYIIYNEICSYICRRQVHCLRRKRGRLLHFSDRPFELLAQVGCLFLTIFFETLNGIY